MDANTQESAAIITVGGLFYNAYLTNCFTGTLRAKGCTVFSVHPHSNSLIGRVEELQEFIAHTIHSQQKFILVGHSFGGLIAQRFTEEYGVPYKNQLCGVVLLGSVAPRGIEQSVGIRIFFQYPLELMRQLYCSKQFVFPKLSIYRHLFGKHLTEIDFAHHSPEPPEVLRDLFLHHQCRLTGQCHIPHMQTHIYVGLQDEVVTVSTIATWHTYFNAIPNVLQPEFKIVNTTHDGLLRSTQIVDEISHMLHTI